MVKSSVDIVDVIGKRVELKPSGRNYMGLCPFHDEKTPSFSVNQEKQFFYCFGCNAGGNVINFIMQMENLTFPEAVRFLAKSRGIPIPAVSAQQRQREEKRQKLRKINETAARYYYRNLRASFGKQAWRYLKGRGIGEDLARKFYLGYALDDWQGLVNFLLAEEIGSAEAEEAGLIIKGKTGYIDRFRNRVIFPICDHLGRFVGFGGRSINDQQEPKYMNSPQTAVFNKGTIVYGLNWSKDIIKEQNQVIIVEGYTDYISLVSRGKENVVASLGTAFTPRHASLLRRFADHAVIAYDGDASGEKATLRSMDILNNHGLQVKVAVLKSGQDPDSFARAHDEAEVEQWLAQAIPLREYEIDTIISRHDVETREGKLTASTELVALLAQLKKAVERDEYTQYAAEKLGVSLSALAADVRKRTGISSHMPVQSRHTNRSMPKIKISPGEAVAEREIIRWLLFKPEVVEDLQREKILPSDFYQREYRHLYSLILRQESDEEGALISARLFDLGELKGSWQEYLQSFLIVLRKRRLEKIEEKLSSLENNKEGFDIRMELYRLLKEYYSVLSITAK